MPALPEFPGSALITVADRVVAEVTAADCPPGTRFQLASVSKQFTATAVLLLARGGALALDDPLGRWFGTSPPEWRELTLHQLLTHTSGIGHWDDYPMIDLARPVEWAELLDTFHRLPPLFAPGARWHYSSPAYVLLAQVAQRVADQPYADLLAERVFAPAGLAQTFAGSGAGHPDLARGHGPDGRPVPSWELDVVGMGAGDVWSTTGDMLTWLGVLRDGRLLDEPYRTLMVTAREPTGLEPKQDGYGYGWFTGTVGGRPWFHHSGMNAGFITFAGCLPGEHRRIVLLSNSETVFPATFQALLAAALD
ncbi:serine hydrolase domain-containing protein [Micromonospora auratinigra]|uniref:CubicO group peptidase, beta-lactamase class C family n=1 Tax=Micromonospora auratinigra TaxID=261654 RepID=A0A1A8ZDH7_9ACTN|nr:serine hydrolase domain-containing protein [Micromonospora auratinigra]SBT41911.1 CubicO group peptidase, beta-lactamase class C family [Micromonospora auratinigra]